ASWSRFFTRCRSGTRNAGWHLFASAAAWGWPSPCSARKEKARAQAEAPVVAQESWRDESIPAVSRIAFVSGGMGGIGSAICRRLGRAGHTVVAGCLPGYERKNAWIEKMRSEGYRVHAAEGDVAECDSCADIVYQVRSIVCPIPILVTNAGITR